MQLSHLEVVQQHWFRVVYESWVLGGDRSEAKVCNGSVIVEHLHIIHTYI